MSGKEYQELLNQKEMAAELIRHLKATQQVRFKQDKGNIFGSGEFAEITKFPDWLQELLIQDMVQQLLRLPAEEFEHWVATDQHLYSPKHHTFSTYKTHYNTDLLLIDSSLKERWDLIKGEMDRNSSEHDVVKEDPQDAE
jgi:hypothetical protein